MSSGKIRRDRSVSQERLSRKDGEKRSNTSRGEKFEVPELNEEEYDEGWEHEWEDIDDIGRGATKFSKPFGRYPNQKWRGKYPARGQNRFHRWDHQNHGGGSDHGSDGSRKTARKTFVEEDENLEMSSGVEITNLKVKIQDGKRFAEPNEFEEIELGPGPRHQPWFPRGRGSRGYHGGSRDKWNQDRRYKHSASDFEDCREVLNRRKRHYPDNNESDLREKLMRKEELGDLREVIESRDSSLLDLRDIIEPPDLSLMDEFAEDAVGEVDMSEDINLRIHNEYFVGNPERNGDAEYDRERVEDDADRFDYADDRDATPQNDIRERDADSPRREGWPRTKHHSRWHREPCEPRERSFERVDEWAERDRREPEEEWRPERQDRGVAPRGRSPRGSPRPAPRLPAEDRGRDHSRNRSRERERGRSPPRHRFESRDSSWEPERHGARHKEREQREHRDAGRRGGFEEPRGEARRPFSPGPGPRRHAPLLRSPSPPAEERIRAGGRADRRMADSDSADSRPRRSFSRDRPRMVEGLRSVIQGRDRSPPRDRVWGPSGPNGPSGPSGPNREGDRVGPRPGGPGRERVGSLSRERSRVFEGDRGFERVRSFERDGKRGAQGAQGAPWDQSRSVSRERSPRMERRPSPPRGGERRSGWVGPRTPSEDSFQGPGWERARSPRSDRSRSRAGVPGAERPRRRSREDMHERIRNSKDKVAARPKDLEHKEKPSEPSRRRDFDPVKSQGTALGMQVNRPREYDQRPPRNSEKESSSKTDRNRKREQEENSSKSRSRGRPRTPDQRGPSVETAKKTPQMLIEEFKERYVRPTEKPDKFKRRDNYTPNQGRDVGQDYTAKQGRDAFGQGGGRNPPDSREWENIRDFQERRTVQPVVGLPFLDEARRQRDNVPRDQLQRNQGNQGNQGNRGTRTGSFAREGQGHSHQGHAGQSSNPVSYQQKEQPVVWQNQNMQQPPRNEGRRPPVWTSPGRDKPPGHVESHKPAPHPLQSAPNSHHPPSNGKPDADFWRRNLPSLGESQWNKPRSDLSHNSSKETGSQRPSASYTKGHQSAKEVIFVRGLARDISDMDIRKDISDCGLWPKDVRLVTDNDTGASRGLAFITFNSVDEATRWMDLRGCVLNLRPNNHAAMDYSNPISRDWECIRCHTVNFKYRNACYQCNRAKEDCLDGWEETCPYPTNALLLRGLNPLSSTSDITKALKSRIVTQDRLHFVKMGADAKGRPRSVCFVQVTSVTDAISLHKSLINDPLIIDNCQVTAAYCQLDKLPVVDSHFGSLHPGIQLAPPVMPPVIPLNLPPVQPLQPLNNIPVVTRSTTALPPPPKPASANVSTATIRSMLEGNYTEKDIPTLAQYCATAYAKNPQEQTAYIRYYTKHYRDKLTKVQPGGK